MTPKQQCRVMCVQFDVGRIEHREDFDRAVESFVRSAAAYGCDFVLFPEWFTCAALDTTSGPIPATETMDRLLAQTAGWAERLQGLASTHSVNIIGGSTAERSEDGALRNVSVIALRDGSLHRRAKIHTTPDEKGQWSVSDGRSVDTIQTDCGPIGVLVCYDSEFPALAERLTDQGARILFVPYCTDTREGHLRVRYCCQARAVENQCYVVTAGTVGLMPDIANMELHFAQSAILTPSDFGFARSGIAAEASENTEMAIIGDLDLSRVDHAREHGSVRNVKDRRAGPYRTEWEAPN